MNQLSDRVKKNLLDLHYNKYLQFYTTSIIILFTYAIGVGIAFITKQVNYQNLSQILLVGSISVVVISTIVLLMKKQKVHMANILREIRELRL
ncbi:MAG: hypothetical protein V1837_05285 [Candidatus Woesearchaeota archaeon]